MWPRPIGPLGAVPDDGLLNLGYGMECLPTESTPGECLRLFLSPSLPTHSRGWCPRKSHIIAVGRKEEVDYSDDWVSVCLLC